MNKKIKARWKFVAARMMSISELDGFIEGELPDRKEQGAKSIGANVDKFLQPVIPSPFHGSLELHLIRERLSRTCHFEPLEGVRNP